MLLTCPSLSFSLSLQVSLTPELKENNYYYYYYHYYY